MDSPDLYRAWHELEAEEAGTALVQLAEEYRTRHSWREDLVRQLASALEGRELRSLNANGYTADFVKWPAVISNTDDFNYQTRNYARKFVETQVAKIAARDAPKPALVVSDGNWELKRKATLNTRLLEAEYDQRQGLHANVHALSHAGYGLALVTGTVAFKVFAYPQEKRTVVELHDTMDMFLDDTDLTYGPPMTYGEVTWFNPHRLARIHKDNPNVTRGQILDAAEEKHDDFRSNHPGPERALLVPVWEGWYMASGDEDGRYVATLRDGTLLADEVWKRDEPPFVFLRPVPALYGFWGIPWLSAVYPEVVAANEVLGAVIAAHSKTPKSIAWIQENQQDTIDRMQAASENIVAIIPTKNLANVKLENPAAFNRIDLELLAVLERGMSDTLGVPEGISAARREPGLPSAAAQREVVGKYDDRQARMHREFVQAIAVDLGRHLLAAQRELYKANRSLKRRWQGEYFDKDIEAKDIIDSDVEAMHLQIKPISEKKGTPEERVQLADELLAKNAITIEAYLGVLEHYDVPGETRVSKTQRRWIAWQMDQWLFAPDQERATPGFWKGPRVWFRKVDAMIQVMDGLMAAELDNAPIERIKYFLDFIAELSAMIVAETPQPVQGPGGMSPSANPASPIPGVGPVPGAGQQPRGADGQAGSQAGPPGGGPGQGKQPAAGPAAAPGR